jgi:hypothetical protein
MPDRSKMMIQTKRNTLALHVGGWGGVDGPTPYKALTVEKLLTIAAGRKESNRKRGQGSSWTVAPEEEEEDRLLLTRPKKINLSYNKGRAQNVQSSEL